MHTLGFDIPPNDKTAIEHLQDAPPVHLPVRSGPMFRPFYGVLVDGLTFPNPASNPLYVAPDWWVLRFQMKTAGTVIVKRSGGDDLTLDMITGMVQIAIPGISNTISFSLPVAIPGSSVTAIAVIGYSPQDILL